MKKRTSCLGPSGQLLGNEFQVSESAGDPTGCPGLNLPQGVFAQRYAVDLPR